MTGNSLFPAANAEVWWSYWPSWARCLSQSISQAIGVGMRTSTAAGGHHCDSNGRCHLLRKGAWLAHGLGRHPTWSVLHKSSQSCQSRRCRNSSRSSVEVERMSPSSTPWASQEALPVSPSLMEAPQLLPEENCLVTDLSFSCPHPTHAPNIQTFPPYGFQSSCRWAQGDRRLWCFSSTTSSHTLLHHPTPMPSPCFHI